jgi:hypothetical protein
VAERSSGEANFRISIDGNAAEATKEIASSARLAAKSITAYEDQIKTLSADMRRLKGNSEEVTAAKKKIKTQIDAAKESISLLTVELNKSGTSYAAAAASAKKFGTAVSPKEAWGKIGGAAGAAMKRLTAPLGKGLAKALGPVTKKIGDALGPLAKKAGEKLAPAGKALGRLGTSAKGAFSTLAAAAKPVTSMLPDAATMMSGLGTVAAGAAAAVVALGAAMVAGGVALGAFGLAAADAYGKLNRQRQALLGNAEDAGRLGDQIQALANKVPQGVEELNALGVSLAKTRLTGKAMVDTMAAVAQATGAVDAAAGSKLQEIVTRGQDSGRMFLGMRELQGTGLSFDDVAKEYAAGTRKSLDAARKELLAGAVPLESGAEALRKAAEKKFGDLNLANAFSLENAPKKFVEQFKSLTKDVDLKPITEGLQNAFAQLSPDAPLGRAVKTFMESFVGGLADAAGKGIPLVLEGFKWLVVGALRVGTFFYEMKKKIADAFSADGWMGIGKEIAVGLVKGITGYWKFVIEAITSLAGNIKNAFTGEMEIRSPSKVFEKYGQYTTEGYAQGVERSSGKAQGAVEGMVSTPATSGGGGPTSITVNINGASTGSAEAMSSPIFLAELSRALRDAMSAKGLAA